MQRDGNGNRAWREFAWRAGGWGLALLLAWGVPWVFIDETVEYLVPLLLVGAGLHVGFGRRGAPESRAGRAAQGAAGLLVVAAGVWLALPKPPEAQMAWQPFSHAALESARTNSRPVIIDFFAEWCPSCHILERRVFTRRKVAEVSSPFVLLRADLTDTNTPLATDLVRRFGIRGFPTVVFMSREGKELPHLRLEGHESAADFVTRVKMAR